MKQLGLDDSGFVGGPWPCPAGQWPDNAFAARISDYRWPNDYDPHYIWGWADCYGDIPETSDDNNFGAIEWAAVGPPEIDITGITLINYVPSQWPPACR